MEQDSKDQKQLLTKDQKDLSPKQLKLKQPAAIKVPMIADESQFSPIVKTSRKKSRSLLLIILLTALLLGIGLSVLSRRENRLKKEYESDTKWNKWVGNYYSAYKEEEKFFQTVQRTWLRIIPKAEYALEQDYASARMMMDQAEEYGSRRSIKNLVSLLKLKTPQYKYFDHKTNQLHLKMLERKKAALLIFDADGIIYTDDFIYGRYFKRDRREWVHALEKVNGNWRLSKYIPPHRLKKNIFSQIGDCEIFINNRKIETEELNSLLSNKTPELEKQIKND